MTTDTRQRIDSLPKLIKKADNVFSKWIRTRDTSQDGFIYCFICGKRLRFNEAQCGHWISRGHMPTRYNEDNCHAICVNCNCMDLYHTQKYHRKLIKKYGVDKLLELLKLSRSLAKFTRYELLEIIKKYK